MLLKRGWGNTKGWSMENPSWKICCNPLLYPSPRAWDSQKASALAVSPSEDSTNSQRVDSCPFSCDWLSLRGWSELCRLWPGQSSNRRIRVCSGNICQGTCVAHHLLVQLVMMTMMMATMMCVVREILWIWWVGEGVCWAPDVVRTTLWAWLDSSSSKQRLHQQFST